MRAQKEKADTLLSLHKGGDLLVLPNVWNPIGARILVAKGYPAVARVTKLQHAHQEKLKPCILSP